LLAAGDSINLASGVDFKVFSPGQHVIRNNGDDIRNSNEDSLVFRVSFAQFSMLFTADAGFDAESDMVSSGCDLGSTVLKVGHHGSAYSTSEEFIDKVRPRVALISAGAGNRFGLPSGRTIDLLKAKNIAVYRTDRDGTIELASDGKNLNVYTRYGPN
jgi:competence protein ComEC